MSHFLFFLLCVRFFKQKGKTEGKTKIDAVAPHSDYEDTDFCTDEASTLKDPRLPFKQERFSAFCDVTEGTDTFNFCSAFC